MPVKIAINGYGRVGRTVLRALYEQDCRRDLRIVAVNGDRINLPPTLKIHKLVVD